MVLKWVCPKPHGAFSCLHANTNPLRVKNKKQKGEIDVKKIISIALALLMVAVMLPVMAMAEGTTLQNRIDAGETTITLTENVTESITIPKGKTVTLNLNGKTLTNEAGKDTITVALGGTLTIEGTGTVDNVSHGRAAVYNNGTVTINGGTFTRSLEAGTADPDSANGNSWYTICNHGVMTVNAGATVKNKGTFSSVFENGYYSYAKNAEREGYVEGINNAAPKLTINGGTFEGGKITIKNDDGGILKIGGGRFTNKGNRVVFNANKAEINGGEFYCPATYFGNEIAVDTLYADGGQNAGQLTITGGTFDGKVTQSNGAVTTVSGGTFKKGVDKSYIVDGKKLDANGNVVPESITIIVPSEGGSTTTTPSTDNTKNPSTGANDLVGVAAAMAVVSLLGAAAVIRKK